MLNQITKSYKLYLPKEEIEENAIKQFVDCMSHEAVIQGALMPDVHTGYTLPIGGVVACKDFVFPSFQGVDISCSVSTICTSFKKDELQHKDNITRIFNQIRRDVPTGRGSHKEAQDDSIPLDDLSIGRSKYVDSLFEKTGKYQLGTLGGGNHFIEIGYDENDYIWITIHSGSRGLGAAIAHHYIKEAHPEKKPWDGAYGLHVNSPEGEQFIIDSAYCFNYAVVNHSRMIQLIEKAIQRSIKGHVDYTTRILSVHNSIELPSQSNGKLWVHRKGATPAHINQAGVIPGNMRDGVFIVKGKGNPESLYSASHGAGRVMSRTEAKNTINMSEFKSQMKDVVAIVDKTTQDEAPDSYKNIFKVLKQQSDLIEVISHIKPLINIKG